MSQNFEINDMEVKSRMANEKVKYQEPHMSEEQVDNLKKTIRRAKAENRKSEPMKKFRTAGIAVAAALAVAIILPNTSADLAYAMGNIPGFGKFIQAVTFREYNYDTERNTAVVDVQEIEVTEDADISEEVKENAVKSTEEINAEIQEISDRFIQEFEENLSEDGYQDILVKSEVVATTDQYFTLKLISYIGSGSGTEWHNYYTIDLTTGERLALKDLFVDGADYITPISENIKEQMKAEMAADDQIMYWIDSDVPDWDFQSITDETEFYLNENGTLVISFSEGDVAPMYMGVCTFEIPEDVIQNIRK